MGDEEDKTETLMGRPPGTFFIYKCKSEDEKGMEEYRFNFQSNYVQQLKYAYWKSLLVKFLNIFYPLYVKMRWMYGTMLPSLNLSLLPIMPLMHVLENSIDAEMKSLMYLT